VAHGVSGLLVPPGDAEALAGALRLLHDDAGLGRLLAHGGRQKVLAEFDQDRNAAALVERFERATVT
jgi:glycosyltransferase involved in cell wall biosynthesis